MTDNSLYLYLGILLFLLVLSIVLYLIFENSNFKVSKVKSTLAAVGLGLLGIVPNLFLLFTGLLPRTVYTISLIYTFVLAVLYVFYFFRQKIDSLDGKEKSALSYISIMVFSSWFFTSVILAIFHKLDMSVVLGSSSIIAYFAIFFWFGFKSQMETPDPYFKFFEWPDESVAQYRDYVNMDNAVVVTIEYLESLNDQSLSSASFKAPYNYLLKDYFYDFLQEYNAREESTGILLEDSNGDLYNWFFFIKPKKFWQGKKYLDPDLSIQENGVYEYCTVVFERAKE